MAYTCQTVTGQIWKVHFQSMFTEKKNLSWEFVVWSWDPNLNKHQFTGIWHRWMDCWLLDSWKFFEPPFLANSGGRITFCPSCNKSEKIATRHSSSKILLAVWAIIQKLGARIREETLPRNPKNRKLKNITGVAGRLTLLITFILWP